MSQLFKNAARSPLTAPLAAIDTSLTVNITTADLFPAANTGTDPVPTIGKDFYKIVVEDASHNYEIIYVRTRTLGSATMSNLLRGQEGTTAISFATGSVVGLRHTALDLQAAIDLAAQATTPGKNVLWAATVDAQVQALGTGLQKQIATAFTTTGTSTAYELTPTPAVTAYVANLSVQVKFHVACGTNPTLSISGIATPPNLVKKLGDGTFANLAANDVLINAVSMVTLLSPTQAWVEDPSVTTATTATTVSTTVSSGATGTTQAAGDNSTKIATTAYHDRPATETQAGIVELATNAEALALSDTGRTVTPSNLGSVLGLVKLDSGTVSAAATLDIVMTSYTGFRNKRLILSAFHPVTDIVALYGRFSTNGGSTYDSGASDYAYAFRVLNTSAVTADSTGTAAQIFFTNTFVGNTSIEGVSIAIDFFNTNQTAELTTCTFHGFYIDNSTTLTNTQGTACRGTAQDTDAIRIFFSSGNISSGAWTLYGWN